MLGEQVRKEGVDKLVLIYGTLWLIYIVTQFRMPWTPLVYTEDVPTGGIRQVFFTLGVLIATRRMLYTRTLNQVLGMHLGGLIVGCVLLLSAVWSTELVLTIKRSLVYLFGYVMLIALVHVPRWPFQHFMRTVVIGTGWIAWASIIAYYVFPKNCTTLSIRPGLAGLAVHPNVLGPCLEIAWGIGLGLPAMTAAQRTHKYFLMGGLILGLCMSNSMTAVLATVVATGIYVLLTTSNYRAGAFALALLGGCAITWFVGVDTARAFFFDAVDRDASMSGRDELWANVINEGSKAPLFGTGYGAFWYEGRGRELVGTWNPRQAHNAYLDVFVDIGALGLLLVLAVVHYRLITAWQTHAGRRGTRQRNAMAAFTSMALGLCFVGAFGESFLLKLDKYQFFVLFWGIMVLENRDANHVSAEFSELERQQPKLPPRRRALITAPT